jgi:hypothetical protein
MNELSKSVDTREVLAPVSASSSIDSNSDRVDTAGYDGVRFIVPIEDSVTSGVATLNVQENSADSDSGMTTVDSATVTCVSSDDINGTLLIVDILHPLLRYVQGNVTSSAANIAYGTMICELYKGKKQPITDHATVSDVDTSVGV